MNISSVDVMKIPLKAFLHAEQIGKRKTKIQLLLLPSYYWIVPKYRIILKSLW